MGLLRGDQAAEKAVKALHLRQGQEAWGLVVARLLSELPESVAVPGSVIEMGRTLDAFYIPTRYPNGHPEGAPFEHFGPLQSERQNGMPVRSLNSSVLRWPDARTVLSALSTWANRLVRDRPEIERIGFIGSYARGDSGPGSDLDIVIILNDSDQPFMERAAAFDTASLPVPADLLVYTADEFARLTAESTRFARVLREEARWVD